MKKYRSSSFALGFLTLLFLGGCFMPLAPLRAEGLVPCGGYVTEEGMGAVDADPSTPVIDEPACDFYFFMGFLNDLIAFVLFKLAVPLAGLMIAWAGFLYLTSGLKSSQREKAKRLLGNVVIGLLFALAAWLIVKTVVTSFGVDPGAVFLGD